MLPVFLEALSRGSTHIYSLFANSLAKGILFALCLRRGNEVKTQRHAFRCRQVTANLGHVWDLCHQRTRTDDAGKARRAETHRTRIGECC